MGYSMTIDEWFEAAGDESEFICNVPFYPYTIIGPRDAESPVVFTTKPECVLSRIEANPELQIPRQKAQTRGGQRR